MNISHLSPPETKTVKELIEYLQTLPPETKILDADGDWSSRSQSKSGYRFFYFGFSAYCPEKNVLIKVREWDDFNTEPEDDYVEGCEK
jgi:hypothetical protein